MKLKVTKEIMDYLIERDHFFMDLYNYFGLLEIENEQNIFQSIVNHIVGQMLSNKVASIIIDRLIMRIGELNAKNIIDTDNETIRACGVSYSKIRFIKQFANDYKDGKYDFSLLKSLADEDVIQYLMQINGVGRWTAEMIALFTLGRENIFSYNDVALKLGIMEVHKEFKTLSKKRFEELRKLYCPYCSYAAIYYYHFHDSNIKK